MTFACFCLCYFRLMNFYQNVHSIVKRQKVERRFHFNYIFMRESAGYPSFGLSFVPVPLNSLSISLSCCPSFRMIVCRNNEGMISWIYMECLPSS